MYNDFMMRFVVFIIIVLIHPNVFDYLHNYDILMKKIVPWFGHYFNFRGQVYYELCWCFTLLELGCTSSNKALPIKPLKPFITFL
jgi:hypothetical protein